MSLKNVVGRSGRIKYHLKNILFQFTKTDSIQRLELD